MMIIDFHTHMFPDALAGRALSSMLDTLEGQLAPVTDATQAANLAYMDRCGIDLAVVHPVLTKASQFERTNTWAMSLRSDRLVPFAGMFPHTDDYKRDIDWIVEHGFKGIKLHPEYQNFEIDAPEFMPMYDYALSQGLMILFHAGADLSFEPPFKSSPKKFAAILDAMKGGTIIAAHLGGHQDWDESIRYLFGRDIYLDTSMGQQFYPQEHFLRTVREHGADKLLFGTDMPWSDAATEIELLKKVPITDEERELIFSGNARRLLGI